MVDAITSLYVRSSFGRRWTWPVRAGLAALLLFQIYNFSKLIGFWEGALDYRYELDYGEGIVWQQMINILAGRGYSPIGVFPAIVYHYPPVYHLTVAGTAAVAGLDPLYAGRLVAILSTCAIVILAGRFVALTIGRERDRRVVVLCALITALQLMACRPLVGWSAAMRVDILGCALTMAGLLMTIGGRRSLVSLLGAGAAFTLAIYTKQIFISGPAAAFLALLLASPKRALMLAMTCLILGLMALGVMVAETGSGFLTHVLIYNVNRFDWVGQAIARDAMKGQVALILLGLIGGLSAVATLRSSWRLPLAAFRAELIEDRSRFALVLLLLFLAADTAMLPLILKSGSNENYLVQWFLALAMLGGFALRPLLKLAVTGRGRCPALLAAVAPIGLLLQTAAFLPWYQSFASDFFERLTRDRDPLVERIREARKPVISDDMVLLIRAGKPVLWEPAIAAELAAKGIYDEPAFVNMIRDRRFAFFVTDTERGNILFDARYRPAVADAMDAAYPKISIAADHVLHEPVDR